MKSLETLQQRALRKELAKIFSSIDARKPRILLLGGSGAGKTSLLANSGEALQSPFHTTLQDLHPTQSIDFWISDTAVFIDPPGGLCFDPAQAPAWNRFLTQMRRKYHTPFQSVCLVVDLPTLTADADRLQTWLSQWQQTLTWLLDCQSQLTLNVVVTHCDYLSGYAEYFAILDDEQQQQPLGFSVADSGIENSSTTHFNDKFTHFVSVLNRRLLNRLYYEPNHDRRLRIHEFPMQLNCLEQPLASLARTLPKMGNVQLQYVFFCSSHQVANTVNLLNHDLTKIFPFIHKTSTPLVAEARPLFIAKMLPYLLPSETTLSSIRSTSAKKGWQLICYPLVLTVLIGLTAYLHHNYQKNTQAIGEIQRYLTELKQQPTLLDKLSHLKQAQQVLQRYPFHDRSLLGFNQAYLLNQQIKRQYQWYLTHEFVPYLRGLLDQQIATESKEHRDTLYHSLRVYGMLTDPSMRQNSAISTWFTTTWQKTYPKDPEIVSKLSVFLQDTLPLPFTWSASPAVLQATQVAPPKQSIVDTAYAELDTTYGSAKRPIQPDLVIEGMQLSQATLPELYSSERFTTVYQEVIPRLAQQFLQTARFAHLDSISESELITALRQRYVDHYIEAWQQALGSLQFVPADNYELAAEQINLLTNPDSPLWQLYKNALAVVRQTAPDALTGKDVGMDPSTLPLPALQAARAYLLQISQAPSPLKMAYDESARRFQSTAPGDALSALVTAASTVKAPLQTWIQTLAQQDQRLLLRDARRYLNTLWKTNVIADYRNNIAKHFPIDGTANVDISIDDFNRFFGPGGTIQTYFNQYLRPFVNMSKPRWEWKQIDGQSLPINQAVLDQIVRASLIQKMFYTRDLRTPSFQFSLTPVSMNTDTSKFTLNIGGQMVNFLPGLKKTSVVTWPGPDGPFVTVRFSNERANNPTSTISGPFALLRLVFASKLTPSENPLQYRVTFSAPECFAEAILMTDNRLNPFLPGVLTSFSLPEQLN